MSRNTVTLTAPNGAKVRTVHSKRYFVVSYRRVVSRYIPSDYDPTTNTVTPGRTEWLPEPKQVARVEMRTDSAASAERETHRNTQCVVFEVVYRNGERVITDVSDVIARRAAAEKRQKKAERR